MTVALLTGVAVLAASVTASAQSAPAPVGPAPAQQRSIERAQQRLAERLRQQQRGAPDPYAHLFGAQPRSAAPQPNDGGNSDLALDADPEKKIVCGMTVWSARVDPDPRIRITAPEPRGEFKIRMIAPPVCTGTADAGSSEAVTPRPR